MTDRPHKNEDEYFARQDQEGPLGHLPEQDRIDRFGRERQTGQRNGGAGLRRSEPLQRFLKSGMLAQSKEQISNRGMNQGVRVRISSTIPVVE